jgi:hypothetical protein
MTVLEKNKTLIYIPASNNIFWELNFLSKNIAVPLIVPAVSGIAMVDGVPTRAQVYTLNFGYASYEKFDEIKYDKNITDIFDKTINMGFTNLVILNFKANNVNSTYINKDNIYEYSSNIFKLISRIYDYTQNHAAEFNEIYQASAKIEENPELLKDTVKHLLFFNSQKLESESDTVFINLLYIILLDREPDKPGFDLWLSMLEKGSTRDSVFDKFIESNEFRSKYKF